MANDKKILMAADPYAVSLKDAVAAHLKGKGYEVTDLSENQGKACPYYEGAVAVEREAGDRRVKDIATAVRRLLAF
jgi:ribose 5-phosphate isomerase RpiB